MPHPGLGQCAGQVCGATGDQLALAAVGLGDLDSRGRLQVAVKIVEGEDLNLDRSLRDRYGRRRRCGAGGKQGEGQEVQFAQGHRVGPQQGIIAARS